MTLFLNFVLNAPLWVWIIVASIIIATVINIVESIITRNHINAVYRAVNPLDSHLRDYNCNQRDILLRIERRCDKIDQRTQAHFAKKSESKLPTKTSAETKKPSDNNRDNRTMRHNNNRSGYKKTYKRIEYDK